MFLSPHFQAICTLRKLCNHPCLTGGGEGGERKGEVGASGKLAVTSAILEEHVNAGRKVVMVSNFTSVRYNESMVVLVTITLV